jgi:molybdopterin molybdotransferase
MSRPLTFERALSVVLETATVLPDEDLHYLDSVGRILREEIRSDQDYPLFDKAMMDGYAVIAADLERPPRTLRIIQEIPAGTDPAKMRRVERGTASRIMTGAPIPPGSDAVLMVEETEEVPGEPGVIRAIGTVKPGQNRALKGEDIRRGAVVLARGDFIGPAEIGVLAACGRTRIKVGGRPRLAVLSTGDELVQPDDQPGPGRIRNSNGPMLEALARRIGCEPVNLGIASDDESILAERMERGLETEALLLSGGVSMGVYDLVAAALRRVGVEILFDRVAIKPGRPFTFGRRGSALVFGCPGNPVSSYVIFQLFARPALRKMMGFERPVQPRVQATLEEPVRQRPGRTGYYQARARWDGSGYAARVLPTSGSADFVSCADGNAIAVVPPERAEMESGESIEFIPLDEFADR